MGRKGFTFVEVLMVALILALVGGAVMVLAQTGRSIWVNTDARLATMASAGQAVSRITEDLRNACASTLTCAGNSLSFRQVPCGVADPRITYARVGKTLTRQVEGDTSTIAAPDIVEFSARCANSMARVMLATQDDTVGWPSLQRVSSQIWVQNP